MQFLFVIGDKPVDHLDLVAAIAFGPTGELGEAYGVQTRATTRHKQDAVTVCASFCITKQPPLSVGLTNSR